MLCFNQFAPYQLCTASKRVSSLLDHLGFFHSPFTDGSAPSSPEPGPHGIADKQQQRLAKGAKRLGLAGQGRAAVSKIILQVGYSPSVTAFLFVMAKIANVVGGSKCKCAGR